MTATLLDGGSTPTLWVDREGFNSGRLASYLEVGKSCPESDLHSQASADSMFRQQMHGFTANRFHSADNSAERQACAALELGASCSCAHRSCARLTAERCAGAQQHQGPLVFHVCDRADVHATRH